MNMDTGKNRDKYGIRNFMYDKKLFNPDGTLAYKKVLFPRFIDWGHWGLIVINLEDIRIEYYDSLRQKCDKNIFKRLRRYVAESYRRQVDPPKDKPSLHDDFADNFLNFEIIDYSLCDPPVTPKQHGVDCGFFVMEMAKYIAKVGKSHKPTSSSIMSRVRERVYLN